jgi:hypothetical protein
VALDEFDDAQQEVITSDVSARLIVDAGPGTGKTAVACARIASLIETFGSNPSRVWMISFTRTAVAEIRARLYAYVGEASFAVKVATLDAHAWALHSGFDEKASLTGSYDQNIESVIGLLRGDDETRDYVSEVQHVIIDEAQDIVGVRAELVDAFLANLLDDCGVTVFADEAQAIYDFAEDEAGNAKGPRRSFLQELRDSGRNFEPKVLEEIYRTSCDGLRTIFTDIRKEVLQSQETDGLFGRIRSRIKSAAGGETERVSKTPPWEALATGSLVLFRTRAEALQAAQFNQSPYSLRLGGYGTTLPPWLAICFHDWTSRHFDKSRFVERWLERVRPSCPPSYDHGEAWERLARLAGAADGTVDLWMLRQRLARKSLPIELADADYGLTGPVIGTVHASKGREADDVLYYVAEDPEFRDQQAEAEEARVLFVGSTRARRSFRIGRAPKSYASSLDSGRAFKNLGRGAAMLEIGRPGDQSLTGLVGTGLQDARATAMSQKWLARHACVMTSLEFNANANRNWAYGAPAPMEGTHLTELTKQFADDFWELGGRIADRDRFRPAPMLRHVKSLGSMSVVAAPDDPVLQTLHSPWRQSGFVLAPRLAAFTKVYAWRRR